MSENDFGEIRIDFKALADTIRNIKSEGADEDEIEAEIMDTIIKGGFAEKFGQLLSEELSNPGEPSSRDDLYEELIDNFFLLISELGIDSFKFFRFKDYDYTREIIIDGKEYDLDGEFSHDDEDAAGALCAIDCLIADLENDGEEDVLREIEKMINIKNKSSN